MTSNFRKQLIAMTFLVGTSLDNCRVIFTLQLPSPGQLKGTLTLQLSNETSETCGTGFLSVLQHPKRFKVKMLKGRNLWKILQIC